MRMNGGRADRLKGILLPPLISFSAIEYWRHRIHLSFLIPLMQNREKQARLITEAYPQTEGRTPLSRRKEPLTQGFERAMREA